jgi:DnaJ-class molecular chaperone
MNSPGDVEVVLVSRKHPVFRRVGSDLHTNVTITLRESLLGFTREIESFDGSKLVIKNDLVTREGKPLVIKGRGIAKYLSPGENGDVVVYSEILWPKNLTETERNHLVDALSGA